jgi:hypothetical protein
MWYIQKRKCHTSLNIPIIETLNTLKSSDLLTRLYTDKSGLWKARPSERRAARLQDLLPASSCSSSAEASSAKSTETSSSEATTDFATSCEPAEAPAMRSAASHHAHKQP